MKAAEVDKFVILSMYLSIQRNLVSDMFNEKLYLIPFFNTFTFKLLNMIMCQIYV